MQSVIAKQLTLFDTETSEFDSTNWCVNQFSADLLCAENARQNLEKKYLPITEVTSDFNRQSVSYQLSKNNRLHRWLKYKEGFSADLVEQLMDEMNIGRGSTVLDPFLGSGTTALVAQMRGINSIGFDILPMSEIAIYAKTKVALYNISELKNFVSFVSMLNRPIEYKKRVNTINVTNGAYSEETECDIPYFTEMIKGSEFSQEAKGLGLLCLLNSLERVSYTAKDGQYLRWDERSTKVIEATRSRLATGRKPFKVILNKGELPTLKKAILEQLNQAIEDISYLQRSSPLPSNDTSVDFKQSSSLIELPLLPENSIDGVITSPPYCNRYDYTRIYALELAYLGMGENEIRKTRQNLLSCTVESKTKLDYLQSYYNTIGSTDSYNSVLSIIKNNAALNEILVALEIRNQRGDINNKGVIPMVKGYFEELAFIYYELFRVCKKGAKVAFVNDNVRYAGEVISVDFLSTELAEQIGFTPIKVYTLKQQKGNSSQQMAKFGRVALRKSITIWEK
ncbi:MAG: site-specific DNA-methyltransferase [Oscillospiraceae bacterium]|jgi:site-specific DNA-methyltransferase (cytosine-N4-specific)|nr:site-specific DNA-methyltransferase [Oscillospiraceae bacterium]